MYTYIHTYTYIYIYIYIYTPPPTAPPPPPPSRGGHHEVVVYSIGFCLNSGTVALQIVRKSEFIHHHHHHPEGVVYSDMAGIVCEVTVKLR